MNRLFLVLVFLAAHMSFVYGQTTVGLNRDVSVFESNIGPSSAIYLGGSEYVDKKSGMALYNIPVYNLELDGIVLPISVYYSSKGFKPAAAQSEVGLHWNLLAGGEIVRTIKGIADENGYSRSIYNINDSLMNALSDTTSIEIQRKLDSANKVEKYDISQDEYSISLFNISDKIFLNADKEFEFATLTDFKIYSMFFNGSFNFWVIDPKGNRYDFEERVITTSRSRNGYSRDSSSRSGVTSWKLKRITTHVGRVITFEYGDYNYTYAIPTSDTYTSRSLSYFPDYEEIPPGWGIDTSETGPIEPVDCHCISDGYLVQGNLTNTVNDKILTRIVSDGATIQFLYEDDNIVDIFKKKLATILVYGPDEILKYKYKLDYGYYPGNNRLKLAAFKQVDRLDDNKFIEYRFNYHEEDTLPGFISRGTDLYGYYNGVSTNTHLITSSDSVLVPPSANRSPVFEFARLSLLNQVKLPTGGTINWEYEQNGNTEDTTVAAGLRVKSVQQKGLEDTVLLRTDYAYRGMRTNSVLVRNGVVPDHMKELDAMADGCAKYVFTSTYPELLFDYTIPLSEYLYYNEVDVVQVGEDEHLKLTHFYNRFNTMEGTNTVAETDVLYYSHQNGSYNLYKKLTKIYTVDTAYYTKWVNQYAVKSTKVWNAKFLGDTLVRCFVFQPGLAIGLPRYQSSVRIAKEIDSTFVSGGVIVSEKNYEYSNMATNPERITYQNNKGQQIATRIKYVKDESSLPVYIQMNNRNYVDYPLLVIDSNVTLNKEISRTEYEYKSWYSNKFFNAYVTKKSNNGNPLKEVLSLDTCDTYGNPLQVTDEEGIVTSFVYGIKGLYLFAEITGAPHSVVKAIPGVDTAKLNSLYVLDSDVRTEISKIRNYFNSGVEQVVTTTYDPLVGVTSVVDETGSTAFSEYDNFGRLTIQRDYEGNIVQKICYSMVGLPSDCMISTDTVWVNSNAAERCQKDANDRNTSFVEQEQFDMNPFSPTYRHKRVKVIRQDNTTCPLPPPCEKYLITFSPSLNTSNLYLRYKPCGASEFTIIPVNSLEMNEEGEVEICSETSPVFRVGVNGTDHIPAGVSINLYTGPDTCFE